MEERNLTPQESLQVIQNMMEQTQHNVMHHSGAPSLIWGYTTTFISILIYFLYPYMGNDVNYFWFGIPIVGSLCIWMLKRKKKKQHVPTTRMDKFIDVVWLVMGLNVFFLSIMPTHHILSLVLILIGAATAITAFSVNVQVLKYSSVFGMLVGYVMLILPTSGMQRVLIFAMAFFLMHCIPGHIISAQLKKERHA